MLIIYEWQKSNLNFTHDLSTLTLVLLDIDIPRAVSYTWLDITDMVTNSARV